MKRTCLSALLSTLMILLLTSGTLAAINFLENGSFDSLLEPRKNHQGFGYDEYIFGWRPFAPDVWMNKEIEHVKVVDRNDVSSGKALRILGVETGYVGLRSSHFPVQPGARYTLSAKALVQELAEPRRFQIWIEWWPAGIEEENTNLRIGSPPRVYGSSVGTWEDLSVTVTAPPEAATASILIIIHQQASLAKLPAEVYVTDITFGPAQ